MALPTMGDQFKGLPMSDLIGGPLMAACDAQVKLANATADFIRVVGFLPPPAPATAGAPVSITDSDVRTVLFRFDRPTQTVEQLQQAGADSSKMERVSLEVPLLAIVKIPALSTALKHNPAAG